MRLVRHRPGDGPAGPVVEKPLQQPRVLAARDDHRDLRVFGAQALNMPTNGARDVSIEALVQVERDAEDVAQVTPLPGEVIGPLGVDACMDTPDVEGLDRSGITDGLQDAPIQPLDQDDGDVA
jgi:hypothetical protein